MENTHSNLLIGQAGVYRVASELALRDVGVMFPMVDIGVDLGTVNGCRIQVKTTKLRKNSSTPNGAYWFKFWQSKILTGQNNIRHRGPRDYSKCCDVIVLWGRDEDRFWVLPASLVAATQCLLLGPKGFYQRDTFTEAKELSEAGMTQSQIGEKLGITQAAVSYQLRGGRKRLPTETMSAKARQYEGRWDVVTDFVIGSSGGV